MTIYLTELQDEILRGVLSEYGLHKSEFGWWREQGNRLGYEQHYLGGEWGPAHWGPALIEAHYYRHAETGWEFALAGAIGHDTEVAKGSSYRRADGAPLLERGDGLFHVWGSVDHWVVPGERAVPVPWTELLARYRQWCEQLAAHLGRIPPQSNAPIFSIRDSNIGMLVGPNARANVTALNVGTTVSAAVAPTHAPSDPGAVAVKSSGRIKKFLIVGISVLGAVGAIIQALGSWSDAFKVLKDLTARLGLI